MPKQGWSIDIDDWIDDSIQLNESIQAEAVVSLFSDIVISSPVDEGRFRAEWQASGSTPASGLVGNRSESSVIASMTINVLNNDSGTFTFTNNLPYAEVIEYGGFGYDPDSGKTTSSGFSTQAPEGVVRVNALRWSNIINEEARKRGNP